MARREITLPTDFLETISLYANEYELQRITMKKYRELANNAYEGKPQYYVREQEALKLFPQPTSGTVSLYYYGTFDALSADSDENILIKVAPDLADLRRVDLCRRLLPRSTSRNLRAEVSFSSWTNSRARQMTRSCREEHRHPSDQPSNTETSNDGEQ